MSSQFESVFKESSQHDQSILWTGAADRSCLDVVTGGIDPLGTSRDLITSETIRKLDKERQASILSGESAIRKRRADGARHARVQISL
jgi:hypothetical protein